MTEVKQGAPTPPVDKPLAQKPEKEIMEHGSRDQATKPGVPRTTQDFGEPKWAT